MRLPNEIILQALQDLPNADLKAIRLVDRQWSSCAAEFLFDTLYISPHKPNIDVFQSVTQHPVLRGHVKKLAYDGVGFSTDWTYSQYFERLWSGMDVATYGLEGTFDSLDVQIKIFIESTKQNKMLDTDQRLSMAEERCGDFEFIKAGYRKWQEHALYEQKCMENDNFMRILTTGLQRLNRLSTVRVEDWWPYLGNLKSNVEVPFRRVGSPLARSWGVFEATPLEWSEGPGGFSGLDLRFTGASVAFWTTTVALSQTEKRIRSFQLIGYIPPATFDTQSIATERRLLHGFDAFARLKELRLTIAFGYRDSYDPDRYDNVSGLRILLDRIRDLEVLELCLPLDDLDEYYGEWYTYESIFPKDGAWPHLRTFAVEDFAILDKELIHLLFSRMSSLQHLKIVDMDLLDSHWESVVEALKFRRLFSLDIKSSTHLIHEYDMNFLGPQMNDCGEVDKRFLESLERYIVRGMHDWTLRHPSLEDSQPTQDSLDFLCGIFDHVNGIKLITDIDFAEFKTNVADVCEEENWERQMEEEEYDSETSEDIYLYGQIYGDIGVHWSMS